MKSGIFTVYDTKAACYLQPFFLNNRQTAVRAITDCVVDEKHQFSRHPEDYTLFELGSYDDTTSEFELFDAPEPIVRLIELVPIAEELK